MKYLLCIDLHVPVPHGGELAPAEGHQEGRDQGERNQVQQRLNMNDRTKNLLNPLKGLFANFTPYPTKKYGLRKIFYGVTVRSKIVR